MQNNSDIETVKPVSEYNANQIEVLEGLEAVRKRPGMYIGSTSSRGLHHLVYEIVDNSIDEAMAGYCDSIQVTIHENNSITVKDNGRGIPVDIQPKLGRPRVEVALTVLHAGGKFNEGAYKVSGGLHGVGMSVVNALSVHLKVEVKKNGKKYCQEYSKGKVLYDLKEIGTYKGKSGTTVTFQPDPEIFEDTVYDYDILAHRLKELSFLNKGVAITLIDEREDKKEIYSYSDGIIDFVKYLNKNKDPIHPKPIVFEAERDTTQVEIALQYNDGYTENLFSYANNINTTEGGTH